MASRFGSFVSELKRRHVWQVILTYAAVFFVLLQLGEIVFPAFGAPDWALRVLVISAFVGFPVVAVLAWVFELTPEGVRKTLPSEDEIDRAGPGFFSIPLHHIALLVVTVASAGGVGWWAVRDSFSSEASAQGGAQNLAVPVSAVGEEVPQIRSLAVLPLDDFSEEEGGQYFTAGMHEELVSQLSQLGTVRVLSRTSVVQFDRTGKSMPEIASELGVEAVVEGSVFRAGDQVRITVQLIYGPEDRHLWAGSYDGTMEDAIALQREVAQAIAKEIRAELGPDEEPEKALTRVAANPKAQESYLKGRYEQAKATPEALESAIAHYEEAVSEDSTFAPAYAGLAASRLLLGLDGGDSIHASFVDEMGVTRPLERALILDDESPEARAVVLTLQGALGSLPDLALPEGFEIMADSAVSFESELSVSATEFGRQLQRYVVKKAPRMTGPGAVVRRLGGARRLQAAGDLESAEEVLREVAVAAPDLAEVWDALEYLKTQQGDFEGALEVRRERIETAVGDIEPVEAIPDLVARVKEEGARAYWSWKLEEMELKAAEGKQVSPVEMARACVGLEDYEGAISYLQEGLKTKDRNIISLWGDPAWDPLRTDPRFRSILADLRRAGAHPRHFFPDWP